MAEIFNDNTGWISVWYGIFKNADGQAIPDGTGGSYLPGSAAAAESRLAFVESELSGKAAAVHTHELSDVNGLESRLSSSGQAPFAPPGTDARHAHELSDVNGLEGALSGKANFSHAHELSDVNGFENRVSAIVDSRISGMEPQQGSSAGGTQLSELNARVADLDERLSDVETASAGLGSIAGFDVAILTYAQYMALDNKDPETLYFVTNAG